MTVLSHLWRNISKKWILRQQSYWDTLAKEYRSPIYSACWSDDKNVDIMAKDILSQLKVNKDDIICEVGVGGGLIMKTILPHVKTAYGIDLSVGLCKIAKENGLLNICSSEASHLPFKDKCFDKIYFNSVFQYFPSLKYTKEVTMEVDRVCKENGCIILADVCDKDKYNKNRKEIISRSRKSSTSNVRKRDRYNKKYGLVKGCFLQLIKFIRKKYLFHGFYTMKFFEDLSSELGYEMKVIPQIHNGSTALYRVNILYYK